MRTRFIEAVSVYEGAHGNHGKFLLGTFDEEEWERRSEVESPIADDDWRGDLIGRTQLHQRGWTREHVLVLDLQTGEGALFRLGGHPRADLDKHAVWVCPLFEPFLGWLYDQALTATTSVEEWIDSLPAVVTFDQPVEFAGYRRRGPRR